VKRIQPFGAFVEILPQKEGLVHVSQMADRFISDPKEVVSLEDKVKVKVRGIDERGRINLTMLLDGKKKSFEDRPRGGDNRYSRFSDRSRSRDDNRRHLSSPRFSHFRSSSDKDRGR